MVSKAIPPQVPGTDKATIDIAATLKAMPDVSCGFGSVPVYIVAIAKPKNTSLPLYVPVSGATIEGRVLSAGFIEIKKVSAFADLKGITYACVPILPTIWYEFRAKQYNVDFGNGTGVFSNWKSVTDIVVFEGKIDIPCPPLNPTFTTVNFDKLTSRPSIYTQPINIPFAGYGTIPMSGTYEIKVNGNTIGSGNVVNGKVDFTYTKTVSDLISTITVSASPPTSATIELIVKMGNCTFKNSKVVTLPLLPIPPTIVPTPAELCSRFITTVDSVNHPSGITNFLAPFYVYLRGIKEVCESDPKNPAFIKKLPKGTMGTITLGNLSSNFYLTDDGITDIDLSKLINLPSLAEVVPTVTPVIIIQPTKPAECERTGKIGEPKKYLVSLSEVQAHLNKCHPGGVAETTTGTWAGAFRIIRGTGGKYPAGTYFWTTTWEDIRRLY